MISCLIDYFLNPVEDVSDIMFYKNVYDVYKKHPAGCQWFAILHWIWPPSLNLGALADIDSLFKVQQKQLY